MKTSSILRYWIAGWLALLLIASQLSCGKKTAVAPSTDQLKKVWSAQSVKENSATVYTKGGAANSRNYTAFRLDLSNPPAVSFSDWDGVTATGQYEVTGGTRLVLKNLTLPPSSTNGTIEFTINSVNDTQLDLTRITVSPKTGNSTNQYVLTNP
ncbi:hypothetical protein [Fibrella forsythiae]|uniref:Lipocalin-like domain-containing protein n=1 Tax=Fibrella forsythiae TaxID=2817061 RepID=A0ABS3JLM6_9BACT|nr:hypothetical protein [Fibrella forsythiae]MBO0950907.1 hypothetical protein [Fibrella forsythiae]